MAELDLAVSGTPAVAGDDSSDVQVAASILMPDGTLAAGQACPLTESELLTAFELMTCSRLVDERGVSYQRQGRIGTFAECRGQEGASTGSALALDPSIDWIVQAYRELPALLHHGIPLQQFWAMLIGHPDGWANPEGVRVFPMQIELGAQLPQAVGLAWGLHLRSDPGVVIAYFGDGASSEGDFYEAGNLAGLTNAPVVLFCQNNGWAISTPRVQQTRASSIAAKAAAFGIPGCVVDGNDVMAVFAATRDAVARARAGGGPTLIEARTYRLGAHNTSDDPTRYNGSDDVGAWLHLDPIERLRRYLVAEKLWDDGRDEELRTTLLARIDDAFAAATTASAQRSAGMLFEHLYAEPSLRLLQQRDRIEGEESH